MTTYVLLLCTGLITLAAAESLQTACWKQDVSSWDWRDHEEMVNVGTLGTATSMTVEREHYDVSESPSLCKKNETFGFTETKLWVSGGCRATFTVCYNQSYTFDAKINAMKIEFNDILKEQQTQIERLEGIVNIFNATVIELVKDEAIDNQDTVSSLSYGAPCVSTADCAIERSECVSGSCKCDRDHKHDPRTGACVSQCDQYGEEFTFYDTVAITGRNDRTLKTSGGIDKCIELCLAESITTLSIDFKESGGVCKCSSAAPGMDGVVVSNYKGYGLAVRQCGSPGRNRRNVY